MIFEGYFTSKFEEAKRLFPSLIENTSDGDVDGGVWPSSDNSFSKSGMYHHF